MRELTKEEIDQVSTGPTPPPPVAAIPTNFDAATDSWSTRNGVGLCIPWSIPPLAERGRS